MAVFVLQVIDANALESATRIGHSSYFRYVSHAGHVVIASTEQEARETASKLEEEHWWLDPGFVSCTQEPDNGEARVIMSNEPTG